MAMWREVSLTASKGRCLVASRAITPGVEILSCPADAHVINPAEREHRCHRCLQVPSNGTTQRCGRCGWQRYCGRRCQQADWAEHKFECLALKRLKDKAPGPTLLLAARLLRRVVLDGEGQGPFTKAVGRLVCNEGRLPAARRNLIGEMAALVRELCLTEAVGTGDSGAWEFDFKVERTLAKLGGLEYVARLLMRIACNGFTITDSQGDDVGIGIFLGAVAANHACAPNAHASFEGTTLRLRSLRPIVANEEICIGYVDVGRPRRVRQADLLQGYGFLCLCPRCASVEEAAKELDRGTLAEEDGWACPQSDCGGVLVDKGYEAALFRAWRATATGEELPKLRHQPRARVCRTCGFVLGEQEVVERMGDLSLAEGLLERAREAMGKRRDVKAALPLYEAAEAQYLKVLSPVSSRVLAVGGGLLQVYMHEQEWAKARDLLLRTSVAAAAAGLHSPGSPVPAMDLVMLAKLEMHLADVGQEGEGQDGDAVVMIQGAVRRLEEALGPLAAAYGEESALMAELRRLRAETMVRIMQSLSREEG